MRDIVAAIPEPSNAVARAAIVADDLTGAADAGDSFASAGLATTVTWSLRDVEVLLRGCDAIAIDVDSRRRCEADAAAEVTSVVSTLRSLGIATLYKKSDSLLRGHVGAEAAAALEAWHPDAIAIATLAFPDAGRITVGGRQYARELADGVPIAPVFAHAGLPTAVLELDAVRGDRLGHRMAESIARRTRVLCCDTESNEDLSRIVRAGLRLEAPVVWIGSGGLARAVASASTDVRDRSPRAVPGPSRAGPVMLVCGSVSSIAREQISSAIEDDVEPIEVPLEALRSTGGEAEQRVLSRIRQRLDGGRDVVVFPSVPLASIDPSVSRALGELLAPFAGSLGGLVVTGGDTASAVLRGWGITGLRIVGEIAPGAPIAVAIGSMRIVVVTKPGAFGNRDFFVEARRKLHAMMQEMTGTS